VRSWPAIVADTVAVAGFAVAGRRSHAEGLDVAGIGATAWPFLAGVAAGWLVARAWRQPYGLVTGVVVWLATVAGGVALRLLGGDTAQWPFVVVATVTLGVLLVGWRAGWRLLVAGRSRTADRAAANAA